MAPAGLYRVNPRARALPALPGPPRAVCPGVTSSGTGNPRAALPGLHNPSRRVCPQYANQSATGAAGLRCSPGALSPGPGTPREGRAAWGSDPSHRDRPEPHGAARHSRCHTGNGPVSPAPGRPQRSGPPTALRARPRCRPRHRPPPWPVPAITAPPRTTSGTAARPVRALLPSPRLRPAARPRSGAAMLAEGPVRRLLRAGEGARHRAMRSWGVLGGAAAALAAGIYVLWGPISGRKRRRRGLVPGLLNLGNTCFMNSLLQGLSSCPSFIRWLEEFTAQYRTEQEQPQEQPQHLSVTLLQLLRALSCQEVPEDDVLDASCLLEVLRMNRWQISSFEEQDAHELFHVLTSSLEDERDRQPRVTHLFDVHSLEQPEIIQKQISCRTRGCLPPVSNHWKSQHPFHGRLSSNMVCKHCEHQSPVRFDTFDSLSLSIPAAVWGRPMTLDHCLHHFISSESVKDVVCDNCTKIQAQGILNGQSIENQRTTFVKQLKLGKLPQCLCIHLQRLSWSNQGTPLKRHEHVQFNEFLVMDIYKYRVPGPKSCQEQLSQKNPEETTPGIKDGRAGKPSDAEQPAGTKPLFMNGASSSSSSSPSFLMSPGTFPLAAFPECRAPLYLYRLMAVVVHHGDMHSGHFVTFRRAPGARGSQWLWISDESVRRASLHEVLAASAYLLFYERVHGRGQPQSPAQS